MDVDTYLQRIRYRGSRATTAQTLRELQLAHLCSVPFENLSIHAGQPVILQDDALFDKIVVRRRGGFCYELNGLFAALLRQLGFKVEMLSAEVANGKGGFSPDFAHMTLMVTLKERRLADVGFGDSFREPLLLDWNQEQLQGERAYQIVPDGAYLVLKQRENGAEGKDQYRFTLQPHTYADYAEMCHYQQTSPQSHFTQARICTRATADGRITLSKMRLITTVNGEQREERELTNDEDYASALREHFDIVWPG
ncbi:MAG: arylamine N-acetyltransferase [bacterium]